MSLLHAAFILGLVRHVRDGGHTSSTRFEVCLGCVAIDFVESTSPACLTDWTGLTIDDVKPFLMFVDGVQQFVCSVDVLEKMIEGSERFTKRRDQISIKLTAGHSSSFSFLLFVLPLYTTIV